MTVPAASPLAKDIAAVLDWWRIAGVDAIFSEEPRGWLSPPPGSEPAPDPNAARDAVPTTAPVTTIGGPRSTWPDDLAAFRQWWLTEPSLDEGGLAPRIAPVGDAGAELMVLVAMPEEEDRDTLLSGRQGRLLDAFLHAAGLSRAEVYRASVLPRHTPLPDWSALAADGMGAVLAHHISLAQPRRMLVFGNNILPLGGHDPAQAGQKLRTFNHEGGSIPALGAAGLDRLLNKGELRSRLWQRWLDWTDG